MNKAELIKAVVEKGKLSHREAEAAVEDILGVIEEALVKGEEVKLSGFGAFEPKVRKARVGTNPSTGAKIEIPESKSVVFKPSKGLKARL
ncbi:MAG: HU family DNA-binding protein [Bacilli bacterium]|jgi:nucleoid DNA-binding protein|nr:HU family DNA-binding protein [Bacilli bacterium]